MTLNLGDLSEGCWRLEILGRSITREVSGSTAPVILEIIKCFNKLYFHPIRCSSLDAS